MTVSPDARAGGGTRAEGGGHCHAGLLAVSSLPHSSATLLPGSCSPGMVAQPCFFTYSDFSHALNAVSSVSFAAFFGSALKRTTHIGASRLATASSPKASAILTAVPPVTQPPHVKPTIMVATIDARHAQNTIVFVGRASLHFSPKLFVRLSTMGCSSISHRGRLRGYWTPAPPRPVLDLGPTPRPMAAVR